MNDITFLTKIFKAMSYMSFIVVEWEDAQIYFYDIRHHTSEGHYNFH